MKKKLIIFGTGEIAQVALFYFQNDSNYEVTAFSVNKEYINQNFLCGLPVIEFENVSTQYPPREYDFFIAISYSKLNKIRKEKFLEAKKMGYKMASYISSKAIVLNEHRLGENCFILENNVIQPFVSIGHNVTLWSGNHIGHHSIIGDHTFISSHVVISGGVEIGEQCFLGVNATIRDHIKIGNRCVIGAGAILLANAKTDSVYIGKKTECSALPSIKLRGL